MDLRRTHRWGLYLLIFAAVLRLCIFLGAEALTKKVVRTLSSPQFAQILMAVFTATELSENISPEPTVYVVHKLALPPDVNLPQVEAVQTAFTAADAQNVLVAGACSYAVDKLQLLLSPATVTKSDAPTVLIVHTHSTEAYTPSEGLSYTATDPYRTLDRSRSVVAVGAEIAQVLTARGIGVIHDTTYNDYPDYNGAYTRTGKKIEDWLKEYPSIQMVLDVHRDALENADGTLRRTAATLKDGTTAAQLMLVVGTDEGGTYHPNWRDNLSWALKLQALLLRQEQGLCRSLDLRTERFNQHYTAKSLILEVGSTGNTLPEALTSARIFAQTLGDLLEASAQ